MLLERAGRLLARGCVLRSVLGHAVDRNMEVRDLVRPAGGRAVIQGPGLRVQGAGCRVEGAGCRVQGAGCRVEG